MPRAKVGEVELEYEVLGPAGGEPLLLIGGLGSQLVSWDEEFCDEFVRRGYLIVRYDNRDSGLSTSLDQLGVPDLLGLILGSAAAPYSLDDMAVDAAGLLRHLDMARAHVVGLSLGGMIAQLLAQRHPETVASVTAMLSGPPGRPAQLPAPNVVRALLTPAGESFSQRVEAAVELRRVLAAQDGRFDVALARRRAEVQIRRAYRPAGTMRQAAAVLGSANGLRDLGSIRAPVMFVHGELDPLIPFASAQAAAAAIPGSELLSLPDLGHDLPPAVAMDLIERIVHFTSTVPAN